MRGYIINGLGILLVVTFARSVDWSLWFSIPVGILIAAIAALLFGFLEGELKNWLLYRDR
jgi:ABC-type uncharacterized transport system permease subunit